MVPVQFLQCVFEPPNENNLSTKNKSAEFVPVQKCPLFRGSSACSLLISCTVRPLGTGQGIIIYAGEPLAIGYSYRHPVRLFLQAPSHFVCECKQ